MSSPLDQVKFYNANCIENILHSEIHPHRFRELCELLAKAIEVARVNGAMPANAYLADLSKRVQSGELSKSDWVCAKCGCTEEKACVIDGVPCHWKYKNMCSACLKPKRRPRK